MTARDEVKFAAYFRGHPRAQALGPPNMPVCVRAVALCRPGRIAKDPR
jgi:hypothetical protein